MFQNIVTTICFVAFQDWHRVKRGWLKTARKKPLKNYRQSAKSSRNTVLNNGQNNSREITD